MIKIKPSKKADTRTCNVNDVSSKDLYDNSLMHKNDVKEGMYFIAEMIEKAAIDHDFTKIINHDDFYKDFKTGFKNIDWWIMHQEVERHHLKNPEHVQNDVNLVDIIEMIVDGVMAGLARSGEYRKELIPDSLLRKAFDNTIDLMLKNVEVVSDKNPEKTTNDELEQADR